MKVVPYYPISAKWRLLIASLLTLFIFGFIYLSSLFKEPPGFHPIVLIYLVGSSWLVWETMHRFFKRTKMVGWQRTAVAIVWGTLTHDAIYYVFKWVDYRVLGSEPPTTFHMLVASVWGLLAASLLALVSVLYHWRKRMEASTLENERLARAQTQAQLKSLQRHIDPHFLFNSFNTLYGLIHTDANKAGAFLNALSELYRYITTTADQQVILATTEWSLVQHYLQLLQMRFGEALHIQVAFEVDDLRDKYVPPLALQTLVENAVKHNQVDMNHPLKISLDVADGYWIVHNPIRTKKNTSPTAGTGLAYLERRLAFLSDQPLVREATKQYFTVKLPLLKLSDPTAL